jgi:hypothetical protein
MKNFTYILCFVFISQALISQTPANNQQNCQTGISIQVFSSGASYAVLGNAAPFLFSPQPGLRTDYVLTEIGTSAPFAQQTVFFPQGGNNMTFNFQLPSSVTTSDYIFVQMTVTATNGHVCYVEDILRWTPTGTPPFQFFYWNNVNPPGNFGTFSQTPLPVDWISFTGDNKTGDVNLYWSTGTEVNNRGFEVQVSNDMVAWRTIGFVEGKGSMNSEAAYNFTHLNTPKEPLYYRLIQMDYDGKSNMSKVIFLDNAVGLKNARIYPNPNKGVFTVSGIKEMEEETFTLMNSVGQTMPVTIQNTGQFDLSPFPAGVYHLRIASSGQVMKLVKE